MKILVTGGCGFIGTNISVFLKKKGFKVHTLDNLSKNGSFYNFQILKSNKIKNFKIDISNFKKIQKLPKFNINLPKIDLKLPKVDFLLPNGNLIKTIKAKSAEIRNKEWILEEVYIFNNDGSKLPIIQPLLKLDSLFISTFKFL